MSYFFEALANLFHAIWQTDEAVRGSSRIGESEMDRQSRRTVAWICGGAITVLVIIGLVLMILGWL